MCSVEPLREFIRERLTAAAEEIFTQLEKTIVQYEEEIDRQRRLLDLSWRPRVSLQRAELSGQEKDVQTGQQDSDKQTDFSLDQEKPEQWQMTTEREESDPPQMTLILEEPELLQLKEEDGEIWISQVEEQLVLNQQTDSLMQDGDQRSSQSYHVAENLNQNQSEDGDSGPSRAEGLKQSNRGRAKGKRHKVGNRAFCQICGKSFNQFYLYNHIRTHTGEKRFSCKICGKGFIQSYQYTVHMRTHTGERPFSCHICGKRFVQKNNVVTHMKVHVGEKGFACEVCGVCFSLSADLTRHMAAHSEEKPFTFQPPE
ncbi:gastrula zinc finger protein XlCGF8.2DB-like [Xiphophorus maculatus]|uniref:gastrula zinc finger protein XlCGF8.2DB-like n=1 Tax=Xiphophorus maculatus TaxID=8083 RepID=UPI0006D8FC87|nr:gastrula zinc finger protein XlCGF8.2DB-like [Xiphophorus maculatus]